MMNRADSLTIGEVCMPRLTERIIELRETVNATAVSNDDGKPGEFLAELCKEVVGSHHAFCRRRSSSRRPRAVLSAYDDVAQHYEVAYSDVGAAFARLADPLAWWLRAITDAPGFTNTQRPF
jgi:hypothetical protein